MSLPRVEDLVHPDDMRVINGELFVQPPDYLQKLAHHWRLFEHIIEKHPDVADHILANSPVPVDVL